MNLIHRVPETRAPVLFDMDDIEHIAFAAAISAAPSGSTGCGSCPAGHGGGGDQGDASRAHDVRVFGARSCLPAGLRVFGDRVVHGPQRRRMAPPAGERDPSLPPTLLFVAR